MKRRIIAASLVAIVASVQLISGCDRGTGAASEKESTQVKDVTLTMWTHDQDYANLFASEEKIWAKQYPQYHITFKAQVFPASDFWNKELNAMVSNENLPNFLDLEISHFSLFMKPGVLSKYVLDLTPLLGNTQEDLEKLSPYTYQGNVYALESALSPVGYYYQPAIFKKYGIKTPITTWSQFYQDGVKLSQHGIAMAPIAEDGSSAVFQNLFYEAGGSFFNSSGKMTVDSPLAYTTLNYIKQCIDHGVLKMVNSNTFWGPGIYQDYAQGKIAGVIAPDWYASADLQSSAPAMAGKWRLQTMPRWPNSPYTTSTWGGTGIAIAKNTPNSQLAWSLLHFVYATQAGQVQRFNQIGYFPNMKSAQTDPAVVNQPFSYFGGQKIGSIWDAASKNIPEYWQSPLEAEFQTFLGNSLESVYLDKQSVKTAMSQLEDQMKQQQFFGY
ncbi:ABC transporter substrate-binding protein [Alicyclobacillus fastidiosus]|uniref:Extracellular solute-binding protein n=1 Tax=Alicyclobacillus fastidiosus TaxID=392011 RepID=A0ABV5A8U5_9BACL|nr:extracellular solute-binding protein [Alicyclobacillus fastidiosus]WEH10661.1 extracellular solute-binding protein [Alicyclobacillus fastidiosus]